MNAPRILGVGEEPPAMEPDTSNRPGKASKLKGKVGERFKMLNTFVDCTLKDLTRSEIAVWLVLYRDTRDGIAKVSFDALARRTGCNRRNVGRAVRRLEARGLLKVVYRGGFRRGVSVYRVAATIRPP